MMKFSFTLAMLLSWAPGSFSQDNKVDFLVPPVLQLRLDTTEWKLPYRTPLFWDIPDNVYHVTIASNMPAIRSAKAEIEIYCDYDTLGALKTISDYDHIVLGNITYASNTLEGNYNLRITHDMRKAFLIEHSKPGTIIIMSMVLPADEQLRQTFLEKLKSIGAAITFTTPKAIDKASGYPIPAGTDLNALRAVRRVYLQQDMRMQDELNILEDTVLFEKNVMKDQRLGFSFAKFYKLRRKDIDLDYSRDEILDEVFLAPKARPAWWYDQFAYDVKMYPVKWKIYAEKRKGKGIFHYDGITGKYDRDLPKDGKLGWLTIVEPEGMSMYSFTRRKGKWTEHGSHAAARVLDNVGGHRPVMPDDLHVESPPSGSDSSEICFMYITANRYLEKELTGGVDAALVVNTDAPKSDGMPFYNRVDLTPYDVIEVCDIIKPLRQLHYLNRSYSYKDWYRQQIDGFEFASRSIMGDGIIHQCNPANIDGNAGLEKLAAENTYGYKDSPKLESARLALAHNASPEKRLYVTNVFITDLDKNGHDEAWRITISNGRILQLDIVEANTKGLIKIEVTPQWTNLISAHPMAATILKLSTQTENVLVKKADNY